MISSLGKGLMLFLHNGTQGHACSRSPISIDLVTLVSIVCLKVFTTMGKACFRIFRITLWLAFTMTTHSLSIDQLRSLTSSFSGHIPTVVYGLRQILVNRLVPLNVLAHL